MKLVCKVCGKEQEVVGSPGDLPGPPLEHRWMMLSFIDPGDHGVICGGGGQGFDMCLAKLVEEDSITRFMMFNRVEVFMPVKGLLPEGLEP